MATIPWVYTFKDKFAKTIVSYVQSSINSDRRSPCEDKKNSLQSWSVFLKRLYCFRWIHLWHTFYSANRFFSQSSQQQSKRCPTCVKAVGEGGGGGLHHSSKSHSLTVSTLDFLADGPSSNTPKSPPVPWPQQQANIPSDGESLQ